MIGAINRRKKAVDIIFDTTFAVMAIFASSIIIFIIVFIAIKALTPFFNTYTVNGVEITPNFWNMFLSFTWNQDVGDFGVMGMILNTFYLSIISCFVALLISIFTALFVVRIAPKWLAIGTRYLIELLASIPSIIFGLFGLGVINPLVDQIAAFFGVQTMGGMSGLSTALVLGMMVIPTITMVSMDAMGAVDKNLIYGSLALGASKLETDFKIVIGSSKSGIFAGLVLGVGRALGEATAVSMVCGNAVTGPNFNLFDITRTLTSTMMLGLHEASGVNYDIRFTIGLFLIIIILVTNLTLQLVRKRLIK